MSEVKYSKLQAKDSCESSALPSSLSFDDGDRIPDLESDEYCTVSQFTQYLLIYTTFITLCFLVLLSFLATVAFRGDCVFEDRPSDILSPLDSSYSPAKSALSRMTVKSAQYDEAMGGMPSKEHDEKWLNLVTPALMRSSYEEMSLAGENPEQSVDMFEGGGYMTSLGVYHELHCLRRLKLYLHSYHYYPHLSTSPADPENAYELAHLNHCIESIRLSLMCAANVALYSFQWPEEGEEHTRKPKTKTNSSRVCVDWERLDSWTRERGVGLQPRLKHPRNPAEK
ncbi:uncharacterized protein BDZ99DRAFT_525744 [Mytilinidion resinicola]|uniref:Tat pathway signal sequence n=1 Tax=Mytilinidion resinicola TaxID=574789 RepID=A0A6A6Y5N0_9PEZI|nr:uncharacterized protein BDZ99DRAFT_525744 [Mytilinidion resinicola]KAF2804151.1 hypothetical protein BDZ99DRAFT_525744 [Mytilinidion resinicola]